MESEKFKKLEDLYFAASDLSVAERRVFLNRECGDDSELFDELKELLSFADKPASFIDVPPEKLAAALLAETGQDITGRTIGRYQVERLIGEGGMGNVYLARDTILARPVALKILSLEMSSRDDRVMRFMHEARSASALNHPNILTIYEIDEHLEPETGEAIHFISMEYIEGKTLQDIIYFQSRPVAELLRIVRQVADGLAKAHEAGIIHRDLKPENLMISDDGFAKILDFGLAKLTNPESELHALQRHQSRPGVILGTLGYMSPEQVRGDINIDKRSDIFSLGCILYEVLTKQKAFKGETTVDALHAIVHAEPVPVNEILPEISPVISSIVSKCIAKDRLERYQDIRELGAELRAFERGIVPESTESNAISEERTIALEGPRTQLTISKRFSKQRKQLTVMFADIAGVADKLDALDPEIANGIMEGLWDQIESVISRFDGRIDKRLTDMFIALFGAETSQESDPENAVRAALEVKEEIGKFYSEQFGDPPGEVIRGDGGSKLFRAGISTGTVVVGASGESSGGMLSGPTINRAKRLLMKAVKADLMVSHDTYRHIRGVFEVEAVGKDTPRIYAVVGVKPRAFRLRARGVEGVETKMVGRESELAQLFDALHLAFEDRELQRISVVGEAGLGKSRLLYEFQDQADLLKEKYRVFRARGIESKVGVPFAFLKDLFFFRFGIVDSEPAASARSKFVDGVAALVKDSGVSFGEDRNIQMQAHFLGQLLGLDFSDSEHIKGILDDSEQIQDRALNYGVQFFRSVAGIHPVVMFLDDLHWADSDSLDFIDRLASAATDSPIVLAEFMRPALFERYPHWGEGTSNRSRIDIKSLSKRQARALVADILQKVTNVPHELRDRIVDSGAGNPLFIEELIKMLIEQGVVLTEETQWSVDERRLGETAIPATLTGVIQSRLDRLSQPEKEILQRASVVGLEFWDSAVAHLDPGVNVQTVLASLRNKELLFQRQESAVDESTEFVFKYALLRDVIYETVLISDRKTWHGKIAEWLVHIKNERGNEFSLAIAAHFKKGGNIKQAAKWFAVAAEQAQLAHSPVQAATLIKEARSLWFEKAKDTEETPETLGWREILIRAYWSQADYDKAIDESEQMLVAAEELSDLTWQTRALTEISISSFEKGETSIAFETAEKAVEIGRKAGTSFEARLALAHALYRFGRTAHTLGEHQKALGCAEESREVAQSLGEEGLKQLGLAFHLLGLVEMGSGDFAAAQRYFEKDIEVARKLGNRRLETNEFNSLGEIMRLRGRGREALEYYQRALPMAEEINNRSSQIMITSNIGGARILTGDYAAAENGLRELIDSVGDRGHFLIPESYIFLAQSQIGLGKLDDALKAAVNALELSTEADNSETIAAAWHMLGVIGWLKGGILNLAGKQVEPEHCYKRSLDIFASIDMEDAVAQVLYDYSGYYSEKGNAQDADAMARRSSAIAARLDIDLETKSGFVSAARKTH